jgi:NTE family protein
MDRWRRTLAAASLAAAGGCAQFPLNPPLEHYQAGAGYRFANLTHEHNSDSLFVVLTFSGGGTRAAALAYGVLEALRATPIVWQGERRSLLDEVDVISSVSGGSFTAAYYALKHEQAFDDFETVFLKRDIEADLASQLLSPVTWLRLVSPTFDRIDLAAETYDRQIFGGATYADLLRDGRRPFLIVNATDMSAGAAFPLTQDRFDLLCSDLSQLPLGRAVAASSAFPVLLSPLTIKSYAGHCGYQPPPWIEQATRDYQANPRRYWKARLAQSYLNPERAWIHLLDGGIADNIGLRGPLDSIASNDSPWSLVNAINQGRIRKLVVITVNARSDPDLNWDQSSQAPGILEVLNTAAGTSIDNYSFETIDLLRQQFKEYERAEGDYAGCRALLRGQCRGAKMPFSAPPHADYYRINVEFDALADARERSYFKNLPTSFKLPAAAVDRLREVGGRLLRQSDSFRKLVGSLQ